MSVTIKYKGNTIASASTDMTKTIKTSGKYCEADIEVINTQDGGITPTGNINITDTNATDVTNYATAQVVDADLVAENIKKDVNILGIIGTFEGGGSLPPSISKIDGGSFTPSSNQSAETYRINHSLGELPKYCVVWTEELTDATPASSNYALVFSQLRIGSFWANASTEQYARVFVTGRSSSGGDNVANNTGTQAQLANFASTTYFAMRKSGYYYKANCTYKWLTWA